MSYQLTFAFLLMSLGLAAAEQPPRPIAAPVDFNKQVVEIQDLLKQKHFKEAEASAQDLNRKIPDELIGYGLLADAQMAQGKFDEAEKNLQWMLDLRRGDPRGLSRAARFRSLTGDPEGALQMYDLALQRMAGNSIQERADILREMASIETKLGRTPEAQRLEKMAFELLK